MLVVDGHVTVEEPADGADTGVDSGADLVATMDRAGIDVAVVSPGDAEIAVRNRAGNDRMLSLTRRHPGRLLAYAVANPWYGAEAVAELDRALSAGACGLKINSALQGFLLLDEIVDPLVEVVRRHGALVYAHTGTPVQALPLQLAELAGRFPGVPFVMGRSGRTDFRTDAIPAMRIAANVYADTSHDFPRTGLANTLAAVGPERMVFCSDFPFADMAFGLRCTAAAEMDDGARAAVLGGNLLTLVPERLRPEVAAHGG